MGTKRVQLLFVSMLAAAMLMGSAPAVFAQVPTSGAAPATAAAPASSGSGSLLDEVVGFLGLNKILGG
jgi:hypothetical protein